MPQRCWSRNPRNAIENVVKTGTSLCLPRKNGGLSVVSERPPVSRYGEKVFELCYRDKDDML